MQIHCRVVENDSELEKALNIRHQVFVKEQKLFLTTDKDQYDNISVNLIAEVDGDVIGTVRIYPKEEDVWVGGRLAVVPSKRGNAGSKLVRAAVLEAQKRGAKRFIASIQAQNIKLFKRLGWKVVGESFLLQNQSHYIMEANLNV